MYVCVCVFVCLSFFVCVRASVSLWVSVCVTVCVRMCACEPARECVRRSRVSVCLCWVYVHRRFLCVFLLPVDNRSLRFGNVSPVSLAHITALAPSPIRVPKATLPRIPQETRPRRDSVKSATRHLLLLLLLCTCVGGPP